MNRAMWRQVATDFFMFILMSVLVLGLGNTLGAKLPQELPSIDSAALDALLPQMGQEKVNLELIKTKKGIAQMLVTFELAALEGSGERTLDPAKDIGLFFTIAQALPPDDLVTMFRFQGNLLEMEYQGESVVVFCNGLARSGRFATVNFESKESVWVVTGTLME